MPDHVMVELREAGDRPSTDASPNDAPDGKLVCPQRKFLSRKMNTIHNQNYLTFTGFLFIYLVLTKTFPENRWANQ